VNQRIRQFVLTVALLCLCATVITLCRIGFPATLDTAAEHWAAAVVHAHLGTESHFHTALRHFNSAIAKSPTPCDVLVAYGDFLSGPSALRHGIAQDLLAYTDPIPSDEAFTRLENIAERMLSIGSGSEGSVSAYSLAAEIDQDAKLPRFRLAVHGDADVAASSADWLTLHDPTNSLGPCLEAAHTPEADSDTLLSHIREATLRARFVTYRSPIPLCNSARYPIEYGAHFGRRVPQSVLNLMIYRQEEQVSFLDPFPEMLRSIGYRLFAIAKDKNDHRSVDALLLYNNLSHILAFNESRDLSVYLAGISYPRRESLVLLNERFTVGDLRLLAAKIGSSGNFVATEFEV
jgi:hypothetical protein